MEKIIKLLKFWEDVKISISILKKIKHKGRNKYRIKLWNKTKYKLMNICVIIVFV